MTDVPRYGFFGGYLGAHVVDSGARFAVWTAAKECAVQLYDAERNVQATHALEPRGNGLYEIVLPDAGPGTLYTFVLDGVERPDPYARFLPHGVHGPALVVAPRYTFRHAGVARPLAESVIYELHVGTFTEEGTYAAARARLPDLVKLGVTTLELLPLAAFAGARGWGYDGVALFAPFAPYGTPDELRAFIDEAHGLGMSVLLDVVYNHFGPAGNYLSAYHPDYFTHDIQNAWGDAPNYGHPAMRALAIANAVYWLDEFRFDGLRLDAVHAIVDPSPKHILCELVQAVRALEPAKVLIAEDDRNDPSLVLDVGLDAVWADDFHHQLRVTLTGERDGYYAAYDPGVAALAEAIKRGWLYEGQVSPASGKPRGQPAGALPASGFVYCIQNHDQIGNRALGERLTQDVGLEAYCMASMILLFLPMTPLLFMGQEWGATSPFLYFTDHEPELGKLVSRGRREEFRHFRAFSDPALREQIPDPQDVTTFARSRLRWDEREREPHGRVLGLYRELLTLRRIDLVLRESSREQMETDVLEGLLRVRRRSLGEERVLLANFTDRTVALDALDLPAERRLLLSSSASSDDEQLAPQSAIILATMTVGVSS